MVKKRTAPCRTCGYPKSSSPTLDLLVRAKRAGLRHAANRWEDTHGYDKHNTAKWLRELSENAVW